MPRTLDLFVIGGGSGGVRAARIAAGHGARVGLTEDYRLGGTCVIRGCVPKKLLVYASHFAALASDALGYGWHFAPGRFDWSELIANKDKEIARLEGLYGATLERAGVKTFQARGRLIDANHVVLSTGEVIAAEKILIATGGTPSVPHDLVGAEYGITSNEVFDLKRRPDQVIILGGGYIAVEFAGIFHGLGAQVTLAYRGGMFLRDFDDDLRQGLAKAMGRHGMDLRFNHAPKAIRADGDRRIVTFADGTELTGDCVLLALGRAPNTQGLGLEHAGVTLQANGAVKVDDYSRTNVPSIFAVGDVTDRLALTPVAIAEGHAFADTEFGGKPRAVNHALIATAVFSDPPIGTIGLSEDEALKQGHVIDIYRSEFRPMIHTMTGKAETIMMKLIVDAEDDRVLGCHILGGDAAEIIQAAAIAIRMGAKKSDFDATIAVHPTAAEELVTMRQAMRTGVRRPPSL